MKALSIRLWWAGALCALLVMAAAVWAHDAHGHSHAPVEARRIKSPFAPSALSLDSGRNTYQQACAQCHGVDGKAATPLAGTLPVRPTNLAAPPMESMREGEIFWVISHGIEGRMPAFEGAYSEKQRWELALYVRRLRADQREREHARLGSYEWNLPIGFPFPNVPVSNPMTQVKVELGRRLFYDRRLSFNQTQSCATCHQQSRAFTDGRARGVGSTGQVHPRGAMSLANVAYSPVLTWANPSLRSLEAQVLVPLFGDDPVELGMSGKEHLLSERLGRLPVYRKLFAESFPGENNPIRVANVASALASFERTLISGDSAYDRYARGDDPDAITASAKRGEALFFSEELECFHCHGGFNFTGTVDYLDKGFAEVEFHNTGLYNVAGEFSYPRPNTGVYEFTNDPEDIGKFKAPTLRNIALTAPYMHDGSVATLSAAIDHYRRGGRLIQRGKHAGDGALNPNKSEFVRGFSLTDSQKQDLIAFLLALTDESFVSNPAFSDPWKKLVSSAPAKSRFIVRGEVKAVFVEDGSVALYHDEIPGLMKAMRKPLSMEFLVSDRAVLHGLAPGDRVTASVRRKGTDYILDGLEKVPVRPAVGGVSPIASAGAKQ